MNPEHGVDIYIDAATFAAAVYRRHGSHWWHSDGAADAYLLGLAVSEALDPKRCHRLAWTPSLDIYVHVMETWQIVVVWRQDHGTVIATPTCSWGKAPDI